MALWRRFGGAQPPTFSPRKALQSQYAHAKTHPRCTADSILRVLSSHRRNRNVTPRTPVFFLKEEKDRRDQTQYITIETQTAGVNRTQTLPIEMYDRHNPSAKHCNSTASPRRPAPRAPTPVPELKPARRSAAPAHNSPSYKAEYHPTA